MKRSTRNKNKPSPPAEPVRAGSKRRAPTSPTTSPVESPVRKRRNQLNQEIQSSSDDQVKVTPKRSSNRNIKDGVPDNGSSSSNISNKQKEESPAATRRSTRSSKQSPVTTEVDKTDSPTSGRTKVSPAGSPTKSSPRSQRSSRKNASPAASAKKTPKSSEQSTPDNVDCNSPKDVSPQSRSSRRGASLSTVTAASSASPSTRGKSSHANERSVAGTKRTRPASSEEDSPPALSPENPKRKSTKKPRKKKMNLKISDSKERESDDESETLTNPADEDGEQLQKINKLQAASIKEENGASLDNNSTENDKTDCDSECNRVVPETKAADNKVTCESRNIKDNENDLIVPKLDGIKEKNVNNDLCTSTISSELSPRQKKSTKRKLSNGSTGETESSDKVVSPIRKKQILVNGVESESHLYQLEKDSAPTKTKSVTEVNNGDDALTNGLAVSNGVTKTANKSVSKQVTTVLQSNNSNEDTLIISKSNNKSKELEKASIMDVVSEEEELLKKFDLRTDQINEILELLPSYLKGGSTAGHEAAKAWVQCLLHNSSSFKTVTMPRCGKLVRQLLDHYCSPDGLHTQEKIEIIKECVGWAREKKRTALSHELQIYLMHFYVDTCHWKDAEQVASDLYKAIKQLQDKEKMLKVCLSLSRCYHAFGNLNKARAFITTAKTEGLKIYVHPDLQAQLDLHSGVLHIAEGKEIETAISYFKEALLSSNISKLQGRALKYLMLGYLLLDRPEQAQAALTEHSVLLNDSGVTTMLKLVECASDASVYKFSRTREERKNELEGDIVLKPVLEKFYNMMLEKNIRSIIKPYERVQIQHVADEIKLQREEVERKLSQMILDGKLSGQLDHRDHCLYLYPVEEKDRVYKTALDTIGHLEKTVAILSKRAKEII